MSLVWHDAEEFNATEPPKIPWVIEHFAARGAITVLVGDPGIGKSYVALTLAAQAAYGLPALGMNTRIGEVAYLDAENGVGEMHRRVVSLGITQNVKIATATNGFDLQHGLYEVEDAVAPATVRLLILDSFRSLNPNVDENDSGSVAAALVPIQHLAREYDVAVILLHHRSKAGGLRGSTAFQSTAEAVFHLHRDGKDDLFLFCEKMRMGSKPHKIKLALTARGAVEV